MNESRIRVLLVEDEDSFRLSAEHLLSSSESFDVTACSSGEAAIEILQTETIDVMVLDHKMPGMTGLNVLQWLHERKQIVPTLMLTGAGSEHIAVEALKMGAFDYIRKDQLELKRLPIVINGLHERKMLRDERAIREQERIRSEERRGIIISLQDSISFMDRKSSTSFTECIRLVNEADIASQNGSHPKSAHVREEAFKTLRQELDLMSGDLRTLMNITFILLSDVSSTKSPQQMPQPGTSAKPHSTPPGDQKTR